MNPIDVVFEDVMDGLMWGSLGSERDSVAIERHDDGSITADYGHPDVYFVVSVRQVVRETPSKSS